MILIYTMEITVSCYFHGTAFQIKLLDKPSITEIYIFYNYSQQFTVNFSQIFSIIFISLNVISSYTLPA